MGRIRRVALSCVVLVVSVAPIAEAGPVTVYSNNFDGALLVGDGVGATFGGAGGSTSVEGYSAFGFSGNYWRNTATGNPQPATTLTLTGLADHTSVELDFLLAIIDSWDGDDSQNGPDYFNVTVDGTSIFSNTFSFFGSQGYAPPAGVLLTQLPFGQLAGGSGQDWLDADSAYNMGLDPTFSFAHTNSTLAIQWFASGSGWQGGDDESWAIENLSVTVNAVDAQPVPEPTSFALFGTGVLGMSAAARRRGSRK